MRVRRLLAALKDSCPRCQAAENTTAQDCSVLYMNVCMCMYLLCSVTFVCAILLFLMLKIV